MIEVLRVFCSYVDELSIDTVEDVLDTPLFYNHNMKIGNKGFFDRSLHNRGIRYIRDIVYETDIFVTNRALEKCTETNINFLFYEGLIRVVRNYKTYIKNV